MAAPLARSQWLPAVFSVFLAGAVAGSAQEALRNSLAGDAAAEARSRQQEAMPYTLKSGDFRLLVTPSLELDWNDNVNLSHQNPQQDIILRPLLNLQASYPVTSHNLLRVNVGVGYDQYFEHPEYSGVRILSGSEISFDIYVKDFWINLHERFKYTLDPGAYASVANTARYGGFFNTAGLSGTWDLQDLVLTLGYDHQNFIASSSEYEYANNATELLVGRAGLRLYPTLTTGLELTGSFTAYEQPVLNDNTGSSLGAYADWQPGSFLHLQARAGYVAYFFDQTSRYLKASDQNAWYFGLTLSHAITEAVSYSLDFGHELTPGIQSQWIEDWYVRPAITWKPLKDLTISTYPSFQHGTQAVGLRAGAQSEDFDWLGWNLSFNYALTKRLQAKLSYRLTLRSSNSQVREYTQNLLGLMISYQFQ